MKAIWEEIYSVLIGVLIMVVFLPFIPAFLIETFGEKKIRL